MPARLPLMGLLLIGSLPVLAGCAIHGGGPHGPSCPAIEAATKITMASERLDLLERIAARPELDQHEQSYLVRAILYGGAGGPQADALVALIHNPACTAQTRTEIARQLGAVTYSGGRRRVADALTEATADAARPEPGVSGGARQESHPRDDAARQEFRPPEHPEAAERD